MYYHVIYIFNSVLNTIMKSTGLSPSEMAKKFQNETIAGVEVAEFRNGLAIIGGIKRIAKVTSTLVPAMAFIYLIGAILVIAMKQLRRTTDISEIKDRLKPTNQPARTHHRRINPTCPYYPQPTLKPSQID